MKCRALIVVAVLMAGSVVFVDPSSQAFADAPSACSQVFGTDAQKVRGCLDSLQTEVDWTVAEAMSGGSAMTTMSAPAAAFDCHFTLETNAHYWKSQVDTVVSEEGKAIGGSDCGPDMVKRLQVTASIDDFGVPDIGNKVSSSQSAEGAGRGPVPVTTFQQVPVITATPPDYHGDGSRIEWTFQLHVLLADGQQLQNCVKIRAIFPDQPTRQAC